MEIEQLLEWLNVVNSEPEVLSTTEKVNLLALGYEEF